MRAFTTRVSKIGDAEKILRLTLLAPDMIDESLPGKTNPGMMLEQLEQRFPVSWEKQRHLISASM